MHDLIIIGAGPAGLAAALYAGRYRMDTLILERMSYGGQIILSPTIDNFPGFPGGVSSQELMDNFKKQVDELGISIEPAEAVELDIGLSSAPYRIKSREGEYSAGSLIIATGAMPKRLGVRGEDRLIGRGVSYCGVCDAPFFKGKDIAVIGAGDRAIEEAIFLSGYARKVTVVHRRQGLRAAKVLEEKARRNAKISFLLDSVVEEIIGGNKVEALKIRNILSGSLTELSFQGVFIFVGIDPNTGFLKNHLDLDQTGFIITDNDLRTSREGIFACGDCRKKSLYQVINACAEGALAATSAYKYLEAK
ncbi:MAG: thioredoxin-disulfide reductase [Candidatus Omnitrophota bacterium]